MMVTETTCINKMRPLYWGGGRHAQIKVNLRKTQKIVQRKFIKICNFQC